MMAALPLVARAESLVIPKNPPVITRQQWGADESLTFENRQKPQPQAENAAGTDHEEKSEAAALTDPEIARIQTKDAEGNTLIWPLEYAKKIKFVVMHFTGLPNELPENPLLEIKNIFRSHTVNRGFGDIGYHYLIDRQGRVYQGRKGGKKVIGGHALPVNKASIGVSLMGNYQEEDLPPAMLAATIGLLERLTRDYHINPTGAMLYRGKRYPNLHGHSDNTPKQDPGKYFDAKWRQIRELVAFYRIRPKKAVPERYDFKVLDDRLMIVGFADRESAFQIRLKNRGRIAWRKGTFLENTSDPTLPRVFAVMKNRFTNKGALGIFEGALPAGLPEGLRIPKLSLVISGKIRPQKYFLQPIDVPAGEKMLRVRLHMDEETIEMQSAAGLLVLEGAQRKAELGPGKLAIIKKKAEAGYEVVADGQTFLFKNPPRVRPLQSSGILEIANFENRPAWNPALNDNLYRGLLEVRSIEGHLVAINELPLEDYLKGIAEVSNGDPPEKIKTIILLARSYARYYRDIARKFPGMPYDLDDDPDATQKYSGYGLEKRSPVIASAVEETKGKIIAYKGAAVLIPYFSQSDGATRSAKEAFGWKNAPYLPSVPDPFCGTSVRKGHGVGVSGCGATELAKQGKSAQAIIQYYAPGVEIRAAK